MKIRNSSKRRRDGMAVIVVLTILSIMLIYIMANMRSLKNLDLELKLLERRQTNRLLILSANSGATNSAAANVKSRALSAR